MLEGISNHQGLKGLQVDNDAKNNRLKRTCSEFESIFITYMLKSMRKTVNEFGILGKSSESEIFNSMFDEKLAQGIATSGGIGLGELLYQHLKD
jgi:peptidoglycan hydrolase FlgJ